MTNKRIAAGWAELLCYYFSEVCVSVMGNYYSQIGYSRSETSIGGVMFRREDIFLELSYVPESYPRYSPTIVVGIGFDKYGVDGTTRGVPLWYLIPDDLPERKYSAWQFNDRAELTVALEKIRLNMLGTR